MTKLNFTWMAALLLVGTSCGTTNYAQSSIEESSAQRKMVKITSAADAKPSEKVVLEEVVKTYDKPGTYEISIPQDATEIHYVVVGGAGGNSGTSIAVDSRMQTVPANLGAQGQEVEGTLNLEKLKGKLIKIFVAANGENGNQSASGGARGGKGGTGFYSGGDGGAAGQEPVTWTQSTGGGGGGGASAIAVGEVALVVAGGGGGAGGAAVGSIPECNPIKSSDSCPGKLGESEINTILEAAGEGKAGVSVAAGFTNSGGGGGGGGVKAGAGGQAISAGNHVAGYIGGSGGSYSNNDYVLKALSGKRLSTSGKVVIRYSVPVKTVSK